MQRLEGKTALVTGASAGIGLAVAQRFASEGAYVYLTGRRKPQLDDAVATIGPNATGVQADAGDLADLDRLYAQIVGDGRRLDALVANAGGGELATLELTTEEHFDQSIITNIRSTVFTVQKALPLLNEGASVILFSSIAADSGSEAFGMYAATKAAVRSFARTWANELKGRGIRVNSISPGAVKTPGLAANAPDPAQPDVLFDMIASGVPLGRVAEPDEVAGVALFLAGDDSSYITGSNLYVDGGQKQI
ncbi:SDR family oxidoreductase [Acrocarpospora macrocephala]|uniref:Oxidoreductase n=1 Tax=Acrocarpospora macrocephala TaxID=150177 RepID=A0A5M3WTD5_9ACTN|nr:SDR family oxidoreductase [Acrocarpospora macrocephala]GES12615.1 oxidoreductase [Acrocarpospora macrocephala]